MTLFSVDLARGTRHFQRFGGAGGAQPAGGPSRSRGVFDPELLRAALPESIRKLDPRRMIKNPVMFVVEITAALVTLIAIANVTGFEPVTGPNGLGFQVQIGAWLWFTVLFATYAEAIAEARGRAQASTLRKTRSETIAHRRRADGTLEDVGSSELRKGDIVVVRENETIPGDGDVTEGVAYVNEAAITGESAPVLKEPGTDIRSSVTGGTHVTSDTLTIRITADPGETFLDRMIALVEGAKRQRTPNEIALSILLSGLSLVFLMATVTLRPFGLYAGETVDTVALIALLVCLIPTTIGGLLSAIGIAGMDRVARFNVLAMSGRAVEASGDVDVILLDKTGTITFGNRLASRIVPMPGTSEGDAVTAALQSSLDDETPEGRSIVDLARQRLTALGSPADEAALRAAIVETIPFTAEARASGGPPRRRQHRPERCRRLHPCRPGDGCPDRADLRQRRGRGSRRHATGDQPSRPRPRRHRAEGHRKARACGTLRRAPPDGHPDDHDHRRQPADRQDHRGRGRGGRLRGRGEARGQDRHHPTRTGRRPPRGDDRGRHQRRPGTRSGRRGAGDEQRDVGVQGSGQHGRPRLRIRPS